MKWQILTISVLAAGLLCSAGCVSEKETIASQKQSNWSNADPSAISAAEPEPEPDIMPRTHYAAGQLFESQGALHKAVVQYEKALEREPNHAQALNRLGLIYGRIGRHAEAEDVLARAIKLQPNSASLRNNLGFEYVLQRRWEEAGNQFREAISLEPDFRRARVNLGMCLAKMDRYDEALREFRAVLPEPDALYNLGLMYRSKHRYQEAADLFEMALEYNPQFTAAQEQLAKIAPRLSAKRQLEPILEEQQPQSITVVPKTQPVMIETKPEPVTAAPKPRPVTVVSKPDVVPITPKPAPAPVAPQPVTIAPQPETATSTSAATPQSGPMMLTPKVVPVAKPELAAERPLPAEPQPIQMKPAKKPAAPEVVDQESEEQLRLLWEEVEISMRAVATEIMADWTGMVNGALRQDEQADRLQAAISRRSDWVAGLDWEDAWRKATQAWSRMERWAEPWAEAIADAQRESRDAILDSMSAGSEVRANESAQVVMPLMGDVTNAHLDNFRQYHR